MTITHALTVEHIVFNTVFHQILLELRKAGSVAEVTMLARLVEGMLRGHGDREENLAYLALDHVLEEKGKLQFLYHDHEEIDDSLRRVKTATDLAQARQLLKAALQATREHFQREEREVFPLIERVLQNETLVRLGTAWMQQMPAQTSSAAVTVGK